MSRFVGKLDPLELVLPLTAFAAGNVDVISFTKLGGIFASAMTGNIAFLALYASAGSFYSAIGSLLALLGFILGACGGTVLGHDRTGRGMITILLATETMLLFAAALLWLLVSHRNGRPSTDTLILILSGAMGLQSICGKKINLSSIPSIVFTSTLTNIVIAVTERWTGGKTALPVDTKRQMVSFCGYFAGAFVAGVFAFLHFVIIIFFPLLAATLALRIHLSKVTKP